MTEEQVTSIVQNLFDIAPVVGILSVCLWLVWRRLTKITDAYVATLEDDRGWLRDRFLVPSSSRGYVTHPTDSNGLGEAELVTSLSEIDILPPPPENPGYYAPPIA